MRAYNLFELGSLWKPGVVLYVEILLYSEAAQSEEDVVTACQQIFVRRHFENLKGSSVNVFKMLGLVLGYLGDSVLSSGFR